MRLGPLELERFDLGGLQERSAAVTERDVVGTVRRRARAAVRLRVLPVDRRVQRTDLVVGLARTAAQVDAVVERPVECDHRRPLVEELLSRLPREVLVEHLLQPGDPVDVLVVEVAHEGRAVPMREQLVERERRPVISERLQRPLVIPRRQGVLRAAVRLRNLVERCLLEPPAEERLDVPVPAELVDRLLRRRVAQQAHRELRQALVHPGPLSRRRPELEQVLVLVRERGLVRERFRGLVVAENRGRLVGRVGSSSMEPVIGVDRHHVPVDERIDPRRVIAADVGRERDRREVLVTDVRDQRDDLVPGTGEVAAREVRREKRVERRVRSLARRRGAEVLRLDRIHLRVELRGEVVRLVRRDHVPLAVVTTVARGKVQRVRNPDLGV